MPNRRLIQSLVFALLVALLCAAAALAMPTRTYSTRIFVSEKFPAFHGVLHSRNEFCIARRPLRVYREKEGRHRLLGRGRSSKNGTWKVSIGKKLSAGSFYIEAPLYGSAALGIRCTPARSKIVPVHKEASG